MWSDVKKSNCMTVECGRFVFVSNARKITQKSEFK